MTKIVPYMVFCLFVLATTASAEIYLRKETSKTPPPKQQTSQHQTAPQQKEVVPSQGALSNAKAVANACLNSQWETQSCLKAVSQNNLTMASNYAATLSQKGNEAAAEAIKQSCAASTAATRDSSPANAMRSAYVECVNAVVEISQGTGIIPDQSQFQLLFSAVNCLDKTPACAAIEQGLAAYK